MEVKLENEVLKNVTVQGTKHFQNAYAEYQKLLHDACPELPADKPAAVRVDGSDVYVYVPSEEEA